MFLANTILHSRNIKFRLDKFFKALKNLHLLEKLSIIAFKSLQKKYILTQSLQIMTLSIHMYKKKYKMTVCIYKEIQTCFQYTSSSFSADHKVFY